MTRLYFYALFTAFLLFQFASNAQDANKILLDAYDRSLNIKQGFYEATYRLKGMMGSDTNVYRERCYFMKLPTDTIFGMVFHANNEEDGNWTGHFLYTGRELVTGSDSIGTYHPAFALRSYLSNSKHNFEWYSPFTEAGYGILPGPKKLRKKGTYTTYLGQDSIAGQICHQVKVNYKVNDNPSRGIYVLEESAIFWIANETNLVLQYARNVVTVMNNDTMTQFEKTTIDTSSIDQPLPDCILSMQSLPADYQIQDFMQKESFPSIKTGSAAPDWIFPSTSGKEIHLSSLPGKVILLDFFYKNCLPCVHALPTLEALHQKYKDAGLTVVGINPIDNENDFLEEFLAEKKVTYTVVYANRQTSINYHVNGYPTLVLLDNNKKIIFQHTGYGAGMDKELEKIILEHL